MTGGSIFSTRSLSMIGSIALCLMVLTASVLAKGTIGILPIESTKHPQFAKQLTSELRAAAKAHPDYTDKGTVDFSLSEVRMSFSCFDESANCMAQVGQTLKTDILIWGKITQTSTSVKAKLSAIHVRDQSTFHEATYYFPDKRSFEQNVLGAAKAFVERRPFHVKQMYSIRIETIPSGAQVAVDGSGKGPSPQILRLPAGRHRLSVRLNGYEIERRILAPSKPMDRLVIRLKKRAADVVPVEQPRMDEEVAPVAQKSRWPLWTGIGLGVAAAALGGMSIYYSIEGNDLVDRQKAEQAKYTAGNISGTQFQAESSQRKDDVSQAEIIAYTTGSLAGVAALAGVYFLFIHKTDETKVSVGPGSVFFQATF